MPSARIEQLNEWERSRRAELKLDTYAHWSKTAPVITLAVAAWVAVNYFHLEPADTWKFAIALLAIVQIVSKVIVWLRLWGAYVERRMTEIEALLINESPMYYKTDDVIDFARNPLFARLDAIESAVNRLRPQG